MEGINTANPDLAKKQAAAADELAARIASLEAENARLKEAAEGTTTAKVAGSYKGYKFHDGHKQFRDQDGVVRLSEDVLKAAKEGDKEATALLDRLIEIEYAYFTKKA